MTGRCGSCRWWHAPADSYEWPDGEKMLRLGVHPCTRVPMFWDATEWGPDGERRVFKNPKDLAFVQDASDYRADLITRAEFGCVLHEARTEEAPQ